MAQLDERMRRIRRNNRILFAILTAFVLAVFSYSFLHIGGKRGRMPPRPRRQLARSWRAPCQSWQGKTCERTFW